MNELICAAPDRETATAPEPRQSVVASEASATSAADALANGATAGLPLFLQSTSLQSAASEASSQITSTSDFASSSTSSETSSEASFGSPLETSSAAASDPAAQPAARATGGGTAVAASRTGAVAHSTTTAVRDDATADAVSQGEDQAAIAESRSLQLPTAPALIAPQITAAFNAPLALDITALKRRMVPPAPPQPAASSPDTTQKNSQPAVDTALMVAAQHYAAAAQVVQQQQTQIRERGDQSIHHLVVTYATIADRLPSMFQRADDTLTTALNQAQTSVETTAQNADRDILQHHASTIQLLNRTAASARGAIATNARTAETQTTTIVNNLASLFVETLMRAALECENKSVLADTNLRSWQAGIPTTFNASSGTGLQQAEHEAKGRAAGRLVQSALNEIATSAPTIIGSFNTNITRVRSDIRATVNPTLQPHINNIRTRGSASVNQAFREAKNTLNEQTRDARKTIAQMRDNAKAQLAAQRRASRARLEGTAKRTLTELHREAQAATQTLAASVRSSLPHYGAALSRITIGLSQAAATGAEAVQHMAPDLAQQAKQAAIKSHDTQLPLLSKTQSGAKDSLTRRSQRAEQQAEADVATTQQQMQASVDQSIPMMQDSATSLTRSFHLLGRGIQQVAQTWATPLAQTFATYLSAVQTSLDEQFDGANGQPSYPTQINEQKQPFIMRMGQLKQPATHFQTPLESAWGQVRNNLEETRKPNLISALSAGLIDRVDEARLSRALRGLTRAQGNALRELYTPSQGDSLDTVLRDKYVYLQISWEDYLAATNYLNGNTAAGARYELQASIHWYNDEESRIEDVMRSLTPEQLRELHQLPGWQATAREVRGNLDGTDLNVFDALSAGNHARADAYRMRDRIDEARREGNNDTLNTVLAEYSRAADPSRYGGEEVDAAERRRRVQREFADIQGINLAERATAAGVSQESAASQVLFEYATRPIEIQQYAGEGETYTVTLRVEGAQRDLAQALIAHGEQSAEARAARLGVEVQRPGGANILNLDTALVDPRLSPNFQAPDEATRQRIRTEALQERERMLTLFAQSYGGANASASVDAARSDLISQLRRASAASATGANLAEALVREDYPSPATAAIAMQYAIDGVGTNTQLIDRTLGRMNRDEIAQMRQAYDAQPGRDLYADLGVFGHGTFGDLSGDDRLRAERMLLGQPRNDRERAEVAAFAVQQQRQETGIVGRTLASGSLQERELSYQESHLAQLSGGTLRFGRDGQPLWLERGQFNEQGNYTGTDAIEFRATTLGAQASAENYAAKIDQYANFATTTIAVLGAIAAAVATVATGGAASPLLLAAIAGVTGLASMGAQTLISGGRYGWEQAATDLGMTAVQALTAGVGQGLGLASRGGMQGLRAGMGAGLSIGAARQVAAGGVLGQMGRLTGSAFMDKILIGAATGGLGSLGQTALTAETYQQGFGGALEALFAGTLRGVISGGVTATVSNAFEDLPLKQIPGIGQRLERLVGHPSFGDAIGGSTSMVGRGLGKGVSSGLGAFAGRGAELGFESARGKYRGDAGDIFQSSGEAAFQSVLQSVGEGAAEAPTHRRTDPRIRALTEARMQAEARTAATTEPVPHAPVPSEPQTTPATAEPRVTVPPVSEPTTAPRPTPAVETPSPRAIAPPVSEPTATTRGALATEPDPPRTMVPTAAAGEVQTVPRPMGAPEITTTRAIEGTAAAVAGSEFRGDASPHPVVGLNKTIQAVDRLVDGPLAQIARVPDGEPYNRVIVRATNGEDIPVRLSVTDSMPHADDGTIPVARFQPDPATGGYVVEIASRSRPDAVERALAHELTEIRASHRTTEAIPDALRPGGHGARPLATGETPRLSPHDQGRLAELEVLSRQMSEAQQSGDEKRAAVLRDEAERLVAHLGLTGDSEAAIARRSLATAALDDRPHTHALLTDVSTRAADNPFLQRRPIGLAEDLDLLTRQLARARELGNASLESQVLELARRRLIQDGLVTSERSRQVAATIEPLALSRLATQGGEARASLLRQAEALARANPQLDRATTPRDPASIDPHHAEAIRQQFGDRPHFQDWQDFRQSFFGSRSTYSANNPDHLAIAFGRWAAGDYVGDTGALNSLAATTRKPDSGFTARYVAGQETAPRPGLTLDAGSRLPTGETVLNAVNDRQAMVETGQRLRQELQDSQTTPARRTEIDTQLRSLGERINARSEQLGEAAGRQYAGKQPEMTEIRVPRSGAGVPDLVFEHSTGRLLIVEAKGGESELGVRRSADGTRMVQQGTREYLDSLAATMSKSTDPDIRQLGQRLALELTKNPPNVDYVVVRQPFNDDGSLAAPEVGTFDLSRSSGRSGGNPSGTPSNTAAAVPQSQFRGDVLPQGRGVAATTEAHAAARSLTSEGTIKAFATLPDLNHPADIRITTAKGEPVSVRVEIVDNLEVAPDGLIPVGRIHAGAAVGEPGVDYVVRLSSRAPEGTLERALAHELTEIHHNHGATEIPADVLRPSGLKPGTTSDRPPQLSPHDHGRLAELDVLARQIDHAQAAGDGQRVATLQDETQRLLEHLGLSGNAPEDQQRRQLAMATRPGDSPGLRLISDASITKLQQPESLLPSTPPVIRTPTEAMEQVNRLQQALDDRNLEVSRRILDGLATALGIDRKQVIDLFLLPAALLPAHLVSLRTTLSHQPSLERVGKVASYYFEQQQKHIQGEQIRELIRFAKDYRETTQRQKLEPVLKAIAGELNLGGAQLAGKIFDDMVDWILAEATATEPPEYKGRRPATRSLRDILRGETTVPDMEVDIEGFILDTILQENVVAVRALREQLAQNPPDAIFGVQRGGVFLTDVLTQGDPVLEKITHDIRKGPENQRTKYLEPRIVEIIQSRMQDGQTSFRFAIADFYMGGHASREFAAMFERILIQFPEVEIHFESLWLRERFGYERNTKTGINLETLKDTPEKLEQHVHLVVEPVQFVLGDDMKIIFDPKSTRPIRIFDQNGQIIREIPVGTPDPVTGDPLRTTREILIRLMQGKFSFQAH